MPSEETVTQGTRNAGNALFGAFQTRIPESVKGMHHQAYDLRIIASGDRISLHRRPEEGVKSSLLMKRKMVTYISSFSHRLRKTNQLIDKWNAKRTHDLCTDALKEGYFAFHARVWFAKGMEFESDKALQLASNALTLGGLEGALRSGSRAQCEGRGSFCVSSRYCNLQAQNVIGGARHLLGVRTGAVLFVPREIPYCGPLEWEIPNAIDHISNVDALIQMKRIRSEKRLEEFPFFHDAYASVLA